MFLDTSGLLSVYEPKDRFHSSAINHFRVATNLITTNYVIVELAALMIARKVSQDKMLSYVRDIHADSGIEVVWISAEEHCAGLELLSRRLDKTYSLCDAVSFVVMKEFGAVDALTSDRHFEQEGFVRLLK